LEVAVGEPELEMDKTVVLAVLLVAIQVRLLVLELLDKVMLVVHNKLTTQLAVAAGLEQLVAMVRVLLVAMVAQVYLLQYRVHLFFMQAAVAAR
jgi:hypothetical protein